MSTYLAFDKEKAKELYNQGHTVYMPFPISILLKILIDAGQVKSMAEAKNLWKQGAIEIDGRKLTLEDKMFILEMGEWCFVE